MLLSDGKYLANPVHQTITALSPLVLAVAPNVILAGFYAFVAFGFSVMLNIVLTIFLQTPIEVGGYGFSPRQNAACE